MEQRPSPLIVVGAPRSGTTYVQEILNRDPRVFVSHETRIFAWLHEAVAVSTLDDRLLITDREQFVERFREELPRIIRGVYRELAPDAAVWGDKNPHYADSANAGCLETIEALFPDARYVHVLRDGRDVVASLLRRTFDDGTPWVDFESAHYTWNDHTARARAFAETVPPERFLELRYEELVRDDVRQAHRLFAFLGLEPDPAVEVYCAAQAVAREPLSAPTRDLRDGAQGSDWERILSPVDRLRSLELLATMLVETGYERESSLTALRERALAEVPS